MRNLNKLGCYFCLTYSIFVVVGCTSTTTIISDNSFYIETIAFQQNSKFNGVYYASAEWQKRAKKLCKGRMLSGQPKFRDSDSGLDINPDVATNEDMWIIAFGEVTCS